MLLAIDVGNTNTLFAIVEEETILQRWRISTNAARTSDEYMVWLSQLMEIASADGRPIGRGDIDRVIIATVVPPTLFNLDRLARTFFGVEPVVVTKDLVDRPERFNGLLNGDAPADLVGWEDHYTGLVSSLEALGQSPDEVALAWDFPIGDGTRPLVSALEQLEVPDTWAVDLERNYDDGDSVGQYTFRYAEGTFTACHQDTLRRDIRHCSRKVCGR